MSFFGPNAVLDDEKARVYDYNENRSELESGGSVTASGREHSYPSQQVMASGVPLQPLAEMWKFGGQPTPQELEQRLRAQPLMWMPPVPPHNGLNPQFPNMMPFGMPFGMPPPNGMPSNMPPNMGSGGPLFGMPPHGMPPNGSIQMPPALPQYGVPAVPVWSDNNSQPPGAQNPWGSAQPGQANSQPELSSRAKEQRLVEAGNGLRATSIGDPQHQEGQKGHGDIEKLTINDKENPKLKSESRMAKSKPKTTGSKKKSNVSRQSTPKEATEGSVLDSSEASPTTSDLAESPAPTQNDPYSLTPKSRVAIKSISEARDKPISLPVAKKVSQNQRFAKSEEYYAESELLRPNRRYRHMMTDNDKRHIMDKCVKSIANDDPFVDDFYFHVYSTIHGRAVNSRDASKYYKFYQKGEGHAADKMKMQVQRAVERAQEYRQRRKESSRHLQQRGSTRPRQALPALFGQSSGIFKKDSSSSKLAPSNILSSALNDNSGAPATLVSTESMLRDIENLYDDIMALEAHAQRRPEPTDPAAAEWASEGPPMQEKLWLGFQVQKPVDENKKQPFIEMIKISKGMKVFARSWSQLDPTRRLTVLTRCVVNVADFQIPSVKFELFSQTVVQPLVHLISEADLSTIMLMVDLARSKSADLAKSRVGQLLLTAIISRGEMLSQDAGEQSEDQQQWQEAFSPLFDDILPTLQSLDVHEDSAWHFLAALALGSDLNRQSELVDLIRKQIFAQHSAAKAAGGEAGERKIAALNLFLNVLGLNATLEEITEL